MGRIAFSNPKTEATYVVAECFARVACTEFGEYALGFFKEASPEWLDLTGNGSPNSLFPLRPLFGLAPAAAVTLSDGGPLFLIGNDVIYVDGRGLRATDDDRSDSDDVHLLREGEY
ncbi:MAG TPA: hypothetical protein VGX03_07530 [Candidatus Binatia bacterium]|jgi:hypothetical protein|nr:hypothetical protein [Candidatus Binatia bacterium]